MNLKEAKKLVHRNLKELQNEHEVTSQEGMLDTGAHHYNKILALLEETDTVEDWQELNELISQAKILEADMTVWLSMRDGKSTFALTWPTEG